MHAEPASPAIVPWLEALGTSVLFALGVVLVHCHCLGCHWPPRPGTLTTTTSSSGLVSAEPPGGSSRSHLEPHAWNSQKPDGTPSRRRTDEPTSATGWPSLSRILTEQARQLLHQILAMNLPAAPVPAKRPRQGDGKGPEYLAQWATTPHTRLPVITGTIRNLPPTLTWPIGHLKRFAHSGDMIVAHHRDRPQ